MNDEIRQLLVKEWDPIGIKDEPRAQNEYDSYIGGVFSLPVNHGSDKEIEAIIYGRLLKTGFKFIRKRDLPKKRLRLSGALGSNSVASD
jgi:hypothetical protein